MEINVKKDLFYIQGVSTNASLMKRIPAAFVNDAVPLNRFFLVHRNHPSLKLWPTKKYMNIVLKLFPSP